VHVFIKETVLGERPQLKLCKWGTLFAPNQRHGDRISNAAECEAISFHSHTPAPLYHFRNQSMHTASFCSTGRSTLITATRNSNLTMSSRFDLVCAIAFGGMEKASVGELVKKRGGEDAIAIGDTGSILE